MSLSIKAALLCDFVRVEDSGKHILVGVYIGDVIFKDVPATFVPCFWVELVPPSKDSDFEIEVKMEAPGLEKPRAGSVTGKAGQNATVILSFNGPPLEIAEPGVLKLSMRANGERWRTVLSKKLEFLKPQS